MAQTILITGAGTGFGKYTAQTLVKAGHVVYAGIFSRSGDLQNQEKEASEFAWKYSVDLRTIELDITSEDSVKAVVNTINSATSGIDILIHNAGHMQVGPAESFTPEQYHMYFEVNCIGAQRLNRAVLPGMRKAGRGLLMWVSSSSATKCAVGPLMGPYFAAKAAMESLALTYSTELAPCGIETTIVVPSMFPTGTDHFTTAGKPGDELVAKEYMDGPLNGVQGVMNHTLAGRFPKTATPQLVADAIMEAVATPRGERPSHIYVDPMNTPFIEVNKMARQRAMEWQELAGIKDLLQLKM